MEEVWRKPWRLMRYLLTDPKYFTVMAALLLLVDTAATVGIIWIVPYTEIDWVAYMQEVEGVLNGTLDYSQLKGDTGPLVYPAGFVYIYSLLYQITNHGTQLGVAQAIFALLYLSNLAVVMNVYSNIAKPLKLPPYLLIFLTCTAYRVHSIFVLRLFNDPVAVFLFHCSLALMCRQKWLLSCTIYSIAVAVKMNILLYAPGLLVVLLLSLGWSGTIPLLTLCAAIQLLLGAPFLLTAPTSYISGAFDFGRVFLYQWTVNWRCIPEWLFLHRGFHVVLLLLHLVILSAFVGRHWLRGQSVWDLLRWKQSSSHSLKPEHIVCVLFTSNLVGVVFSRSLHYQFYVWYFYSLPLLLWTTPLPTIISIPLLLLIEYSWNVYPSTLLSSLLLHTAHTVLITALWLSPTKFKLTLDEKTKHS